MSGDYARADDLPGGASIDQQRLAPGGTAALLVQSPRVVANDLSERRLHATIVL